MTTELLEELEIVIKRFRVAPEKVAAVCPTPPAEPGEGTKTAEEGEKADPADVVTITWQRVTDRAPSVTVTVPAGVDCWALPIPHRPPWLLDLIVKNAPKWWLK